MKEISTIKEDDSSRIKTLRSKRPSDNQLWKLASRHAHRITTLSFAKKLLNINGFVKTNEVASLLLSRAKTVLERREERLSDRIKKRTGKRVYLSADNSETPTLSLAERLIERRRSLVVASAKLCLRYGAAGGTSFTVWVASTVQDTNYTIYRDWNRDTYRGRFKRWLALEDHHSIGVPHDWLTRVHKRGLACAGGMLTLSVLPLMPAGDIEVFQARWVEQSRGYSVHVRDGFIARKGEVVFHADTAEKAVAGVRRAMSGVERRPGSRSPYKLTVDAFIKRYAKHASLEISLDDAYDAGCCEYGVRSWCQLVGIDYDAGSVPLSQVLDGFRVAPLIEVRRTVVKALANHRRRSKA